ncbi:MAG: OmpA family protein [Gemmatimonadetes bacterium]|nr:OmpA family protein [Gemmatimonadota bacterium]
MRTGRSHHLAIVAVTLATQLGTTACASMNKTAKGGIIGAGAGGVVGAAVGKATGNVARGAIIGAAIGGAAGAIIGHQMDKQAEEITATVPGATVTRVGEGMVVTFDSGILFDFDRSDLRPAAQENLRNLATSLQKYPGEEVLVVGHTDAQGSDSYNQALSERRAQAAADFLQAQGVAASRIHTRGMGESDPVADNDTEAGRQANRRVEVVLYASEAWRKQVQQSVSSGR